MPRRRRGRTGGSGLSLRSRPQLDGPRAYISSLALGAGFMTEGNSGSVARRRRQPLQASQQSPPVLGRNLLQCGRQPAQVQNAVLPHSGGTGIGQDDRELALVLRIAVAGEKAPALEALDLLGRGALGHAEMAREHAEWNAFLGGDVMKQLALVLRQVFGVGLEQDPP